MSAGCNSAIRPFSKKLLELFRNICKLNAQPESSLMKAPITVLLLFLAFSCVAQKRNTTDTKLFNGKDLTGWKVLNGKAKFEVKDGMIVGTTVANEPNSFLATEELFGDFILELEFKVADGTNSAYSFGKSKSITRTVVYMGININ